jgi:hypothetical protein
MTQRTTQLSRCTGSLLPPDISPIHPCTTFACMVHARARLKGPSPAPTRHTIQSVQCCNKECSSTQPAQNCRTEEQWAQHLPVCMHVRHWGARAYLLPDLPLVGDCLPRRGGRSGICDDSRGDNVCGGVQVVHEHDLQHISRHSKQPGTCRQARGMMTPRALRLETTSNGVNRNAEMQSALVPVWSFLCWSLTSCWPPFASFAKMYADGLTKDP